MTKTLTIENKMGLWSMYTISTDVQVVNKDTKAHKLVYAIATADRSSDPITLSDNWHGICGVLHEHQMHKPVYTAWDAAPVKLCSESQSGTRLIMHGGLTPEGKGKGQSAEFVEREKQMNVDIPGAFKIDCWDFKKDSGVKHFVGVGLPDPYDNNNIVPISVVEAMPGESYAFEPRPVYCISYAGGESARVQAGHIIEPDARPGTEATVDCTKDNQSHVTVFHQPWMALEVDWDGSVWKRSEER